MKLKLDIESISEEFFCDSRLLGVITSAKCYHFCWQINAALGFKFRLNPTNEIKLQRKDRRYFFHVYEFKETSNYLTHYLYNNQFDGEYLLPEFKHIDFLWLMKDDIIADEFCYELIQSVKHIKDVQLVTELVTETKNRNNLIF